MRLSDTVKQLQHHTGSRMAAGLAPFCNLPQDLLYCITKHLRPYSQRNVFLTCPRLYSNWKIQLQEGDHKLQFLTWALHYLDCSPSVTGYPDHIAMLQCCSPEQQIVGDIQAAAPNSLHFKFGCRQRILTNNEGIVRNGAKHWHPQSAWQILHRLTASPESTSVRLRLSTCPGLSQNRVSELAQIWFSFLVNNKGFLLLSMKKETRGQPGVSQGSARGPFQEQDAITIVHLGSEWTMNGALCKTAPPVLDLDIMPGSVCEVAAQLHSANSNKSRKPVVSKVIRHYGACLTSTEAQYNFAYQKNVDHAAIVESIYQSVLMSVSVVVCIDTV